MFDFKSSQGTQCGLVVYSWGAEALCLRACHAQTILALHEIIVCGKQEAAPVLQPRHGVEHEIVLVAALQHMNAHRPLAGIVFRPYRPIQLAVTHIRSLTVRTVSIGKARHCRIVITVTHYGAKMPM